MITRHDNKNGTTTFTGVSVTIPTSVAEKYDVAAVRSGRKNEGILTCSDRVEHLASNSEWVYVILAPRPTWKPPASLAPGRYIIRNGTLRTDAITLSGREARHQLFRDFTTPSREGIWQVNEDGTATYLGEA